MLETGGGSVILTGSFVGASSSLLEMGAYSTARSGLLGLVKAITAEDAARRIRANALLTEGTATPTTEGPEQREWAASLHAVKRIAEPEETAQAALFLASDMSSFVTLSALPAEGSNAAFN